VIVFGEGSCFRHQLASPGDPRHCARHGEQRPAATARAGKLTSATPRGLAATGQERCSAAPRQAAGHKSRFKT